MLPVAILAGGLASRLRPITETVPKALVEVAGQPFIIRQLDYLREQGVRTVVLCVGYLGDMIEAVVGDGSKFGIDVRYSPDGSTLLGTGGALKKAVRLLDEHFFVLYGDSFLPLDFQAVHRAYLASGKDALMTVQKNCDRGDKSNVLFTHGKLVEYNKRSPRTDMTYIDYGLGVLTAKVLFPYPSNQAFDLADVYQALSLRGELAGMEVYERFYEIGSHAGLHEAGIFFSTKDKK